ncbi:hypothetical protein GCM10028804_24660 [Larkinella terrae]
MNFSTPVAFRLVLLSLCLDACTPHFPAQENTACSLANFRIINKTTDPLLAKVREETVVIDGQSLKIGESSRIAYTFDQQNRPVEDVYSAYGFSDYNGSETYEYSPNLLTVKTKNATGVVSEVTFPLNDRGLLVSAKYNADGLATEEVSDSYRITYTIENGNVVRKETRDLLNNALYGVVVYEYDLNRANLPNVAPHKGKKSRNLPVKETYLNYAVANGGPTPTTIVYQYTYTFDSSGRPSRRYNTVSGSPGKYEVVDFEYTCR